MASDGHSEPLVRYRVFMADSARWLDFEHRPGDIVISTPPKSGTTWTQMLCALLIFDGPDFPAPLADLSPWLDMHTRTPAETAAIFAAQTHRRFIKTHTPLDGLPMRDDVTYLVVGRDPRDVIVSWEHHVANVNIERLVEVRGGTVGFDDLAEIGPPRRLADDPHQRFVDFVDDDRDPSVSAVSLRSVLHHLTTGWERRDRPNVALFHYADLRADLVGEMERLARVLGIATTRDRLEVLADAAGIDRMRERAHAVAPDTTTDIWKDAAAFFRSGGSGEWRERLLPGDAEHYAERVAALAEPDLARWAHEGWRASGLPRPGD